MNILFSAGGTLGHIYPAITLMNEYLKSHNNKQVYFLVNNKDQKFLKKLEIPKEVEIIYYEAYGFSKSIFKLVKAVIINTITYNKVKKLIKKNNIKVVIGMGGYISGIAIKAGKTIGAKTIIHEQNSVIGLANKLSLKYTDLFLTTFPMKKLKNKQIEVGNPRYFEAKIYANNFLKDKSNLLIMSGTLGAEQINSIAIEFLKNDFSRRFTTIIITGARYYNEYKNKIKPNPNFQIIPFSNETLKLISQSGIVISRAGSSSIFEILGAGSIPILIPSPNVTKNHQFYNAKSILDKGLGYMIEEKELTITKLIDTIKIALNNYDEMINKIDEYAKKNDNKDIMMYIDEIEREIV